MIELPEALTLAKQCNASLAGKTVSYVLPPAKPHKFCWFCGEPSAYEGRIRNAHVSSAAAFGIYAELAFDNGYRLSVNDGVNMRLIQESETPKNYQLVIGFTDRSALVFTVAMYGGIVLHDGGYDNEYYLKSKAAVSPFDASFPDYFAQRLSDSKPSLSAKAFLATEQRFPGIGNGVSQDILFSAGLLPKRKLGTLDTADTERLLHAIIRVLREMTDRGGRDTEKDLYGQPGGYVTKMSKNAITAGCPVCGEAICKENYLGGSVYYCPHCQK